MQSEDFELEVFFTPIGDEKVLVVRAVDAEAPTSGKSYNLPTSFSKVGLLATAVMDLLGEVGAQGAELFEMSPNSYRQYKGGQLDEVGSYFRAVLRNQKGQTSHQVELRAVQRAQGPPGANLIMAAQMMAIQAQLDRIEDTLATLSESVSDIMQFLEIQQRAEIEAAIGVLKQVHARARATRDISGTDWGRVVGLEQVLMKQLKGVKYELQNLLESPEFGNTPKDDHQRMERIKPDRVIELTRYYWLLSDGVRGWNELQALRKYQEGELTDMDVSDIISKMKELRAERESILTAIDRVVSAAKRSKPRGQMEMWLSREGRYRAKKNDTSHLRVIAEKSEALENLRIQLHAGLPNPSPPPMLINAEDDATETRPAIVERAAQDQETPR